MRIHRHFAGRTTVLELSGTLVVEPSADTETALRTSIDEVLGFGCREVVLDLSRVDSMDAMGLGEIVRAFNAVRGRGGNLRLSSPSPRVDRLLSITKLRSVIDVVPASHAASAAHLETDAYHPDPACTSGPGRPEVALA